MLSRECSEGVWRVEVPCACSVAFDCNVYVVTAALEAISRTNLSRAAERSSPCCSERWNYGEPETGFGGPSDRCSSHIDLGDHWPKSRDDSARRNRMRQVEQAAIVSVGRRSAEEEGMETVIVTEGMMCENSDDTPPVGVCCCLHCANLICDCVCVCVCGVLKLKLQWQR